jgi:hypothetical protein
VNRAVSLTLWLGTIAGVGLCAAAAVAQALSLPTAATLARLGVLALFATPPLRLAVVTAGFVREDHPRLALASGAVLLVLLATAIRAAT